MQDKKESFKNYADPILAGSGGSGTTPAVLTGKPGDGGSGIVRPAKPLGGSGMGDNK